MKSILAVGPSGTKRIFSSVRATSRALSGTGTDGLKSRISRVARAGGGYVGRTYIKFA